MSQTPPTLVAVASICLALAACSKEIKPDKKGGFLVQNEKLIEISAVNLETQFTPEGFALNYFTGDVAVSVRTGDYLILYGDYKPYGLNVYQQKSGYFEQDTSKGAASDAITSGPLKGEKEMLKIRFSKPLPAGIYLLECQQSKGTIGFPFRIE